MCNHKELKSLRAQLQAAEQESEAEHGRWQEAIYKLLCKHVPDNKIDGAGCDSGDPLDFTLTEINQAINHLQEAAEQSAKLNQEARECVWSEDANAVWEASCGEAFCLESDGPSENRMKFCPYCAGKLIEKKYVEPPIEDERDEPPALLSQQPSPKAETQGEKI